MALRDCIGAQEHQRDRSSMTRSMLVLVHYDEKGSCHGVVQSSLPGCERPFRDLGELVLAVDELCRELESEREGLEAIPTFGKSPFDGLASRADDILTIEIERRDYETLQGRVRGRITDGRSIRFPSALALIRLLSGSRKEGQSHES